MIEFENVSMTYPNGTVALDNVNLQIGDGEFVFVVGASGAGKSTLMKLLLREEKVTSGRLTVDEFDLTDLPERQVPYYRRELGVVLDVYKRQLLLRLLKYLKYLMKRAIYKRETI